MNPHDNLPFICTGNAVVPKRRLDILVALPIERLDRPSLHKKVQDIAAQ